MVELSFSLKFGVEVVTGYWCRELFKWTEELFRKLRCAPFRAL